MDLLTANERILILLSDADGPITLGLLPVEEAEQLSLIEHVVEKSNGQVNRLISLLNSQSPAAVTYALAAAASQAVTQGGTFWPAFSLRLRLDLERSVDRERLAKCFSMACRKLGVIDPDVSSMAWANVAPLMAQASILHCWAEVLAKGTLTTLKHRPPPDLSDWGALVNFAKDLSRHVHNQPNLRNILQTEVGGILVHRLIQSCVFGQFNFLPPHLREPMKLAFEGEGRQVSLKSPYATFSIADGGFVLVLPKQPLSLISDRSIWEVGSNQYSLRSELRIPEQEIGTGSIDVRIRNLRRGYGDQSFKVDLSLSVTFRVFDMASGRERTVRYGSETELPPGEYLVVMNLKAYSDVPEAEELLGSYRLLEGLELRPGTDGLHVEMDGESSIITPALKAGLYHSADAGNSTELEGGQRLHFGDSFNLLAYVPKNQHAGHVLVTVSSGDTKLLSEPIPLQDENVGVFDYSREVEDVMQKVVSNLNPGVHPLKVRLSTAAASVTRDLWFWKGLKRISMHKGFHYELPPTNIDYARSRGIKREKHGFGLDPSHYAPRISIALQGGEMLTLLRPGIHATCCDPTEGETIEIRPGEALTITDSDNRILQFESGGFENWVLECQGKIFAKLDSKRTVFRIGLRSLVAQFGKSGMVEARSDTSETLRLVRFTSGLIAKRIEMELDHGRSLECWRTTVPSDALGLMGLRISDYSDSPEPQVIPVIVVYEEGKDQESSECKREVIEGITIRTKYLLAEGTQPERVKLTLEIAPEKIASKFLLIDFVQAPLKSDAWQPLQCADFTNPSRLSVVVTGSAPLEPEKTTWWRHLWRTSNANNSAASAGLYGQIGGDNVSRGLREISFLTAIKYPSPVYSHSARYLSSLAHKLVIRRKRAGHRDTDAWWTQGALELERHAITKVTPVVRQFLFSCNPQSLRRRWSKVLSDNISGSGIVVPALRLGCDVGSAGGRVPYAAANFHAGRHPSELFCSFSNFGAVSGGKDSEFEDFNYRKFFEPLFTRIEQYEESATPLDAAPLLSARHLLMAIHALNRRARVLVKASSGDADHPLAPALGGLTVALQASDNFVPTLHQKIGFVPWASKVNLDRPDHFETPNAPDLPLLESDYAERLNRLTWHFCVLARGTAYGRVEKEWFKSHIKVFSGETVQSHSLNLILSFAPELFAYYIGLLDFVNFSPYSKS